MGLRGDDGRSDKKVQSAIPVWKQESRRHGWQFDKAAGIGFVAETLNRHSGPDPESRVFNRPGAESTKDSGLRLPPEWQWVRPLNGLWAWRRGDYHRSGNGVPLNIPMAPGPAPSSRWRAAVLADATKNSVHQRTGRFEHSMCSGVARHASVTPAPCDCNTAESETDDREESRLNL